MQDILYIASRKGLLTFVPDGDGWRLEGSAFLGDPVSAVLRDERNGTLFAALDLGHFGNKLHRSRDDGATWEEVAVPAYPEAAAEGDAEGASLRLLWTLAAGGEDQPGLLWAGTIPGGLFRSSDLGESWTLIEELWNKPEREKWFGGGYDEPGIHSICIDPRDSSKITLGVSCGGVWTSADAGESWQQGGNGLRAEYVPPNMEYDPVAQDPHLLTQCPAAPDVIWCQHHNGIFLSRDRGDTFTEIETAKPSAFGFAVAVHPADPETAWFVPAVKDEDRRPV
ncbi:MAG: exo-alpha-sialidase, partial [Pseudomonadota bacterium]